ncbi:cation:proton antiporter [Sphaerochaeta sp. PS]|uniref:cation:proton antiporter n=1 Tax=Sphaerochaeta sp. PS TaxID=3076336 RepID=UPI0028A3408D|nr:cation:proton antiporter [Sphaerochaeta sp. PS]MDT4762833.1 cation:proton antiporter [Sphaerochaeta sp. PS]
MALSLALIILLCLLVEWAFSKLGLPGLLGMIVVGALLGPSVLNLLDPSILLVGSDLRLMALIVILLRSGFKLSKKSLNLVGKNALLLGFLPATFEASVIFALGPMFLPISRMEAAIMGCVLAAVSPAVVVPYMIKFIEEGRGTKKSIPTMVLAGSSLDDVTVIVAYSVLIGMYSGGKVNIAWKLAGIPLSILSGILVGIVFGLILVGLFERFDPRATKRTLVVLSLAILLVDFGNFLGTFGIPYAPLISVMTIGFVILEKRERMAHEISSKLAKIWVFAQILLFSLVGSQVNFRAALDAGLKGVALIFIALIGRSVGTYLCTFGAGLTQKERLFVVLSYIPKATVQAAIGAAPLAVMAAHGMDTRPGEIILAMAVMSIVLTAPLGAWVISWAGKALLVQEKSS